MIFALVKTTAHAHGALFFEKWIKRSAACEYFTPSDAIHKVHVRGIFITHSRLSSFHLHMYADSAQQQLTTKCVLITESLFGNELRAMKIRVHEN